MTNRVRELRHARGWTQRQLADVVHVTRQTVIAIEVGKAAPGLALAISIARAFGVSVEDVFA